MQQTHLFEFDPSTQHAETFFEEYHSIVDDLKKEINDCKNEQTRLRNELETVRSESKTANEVAKDYFSQIQDEKCLVHSETENTIILNLEKRLNLMQMEKESVFQLWQMSLKAIEVLEDELKSSQQGKVDVQLYEDQVSKIKEAYSNAIRELEGKLIQSKEHFLMHQNLFESNKSQIDQLMKEKDDLYKKIKDYETNLKEKEETYKNLIDECKEKLKSREIELENLNKTSIQLQEKLTEAQRVIANVAAKDNETVTKVSEALELVEAALREKEEVLRRESHTIEEANQLRCRFNDINKEYSDKFDNEVFKIKELYEENLKKYISEIEELKMEVHQKATLTDRMQRECRLAQEELDKVRQSSDNFCQKSEMKILELERKLQETQLKLQTCEETWNLKYNEKCRILEQYDKLLNDKLYEPNEKLKKFHLQNSNGVEDLVKEVNERTKEAILKYSNIEKSLSQSLSDKNKIDEELRSLHMAFERESERRDYERKLIETKIKELQEHMPITTSNTNDSQLITEQIHLLKDQLKKNLRIELAGNNELINVNTDIKFKQLQEMNEAKIKELTSHVETHQKLSNRWKEEIQLLTNKFKKHTKEMKNKLYTLQQENEELNKELYACRKKLFHNMQVTTLYKPEDEIR